MSVFIGLGGGLELRTFTTNHVPPREHLGISLINGSNETRLDLGPLTIVNIQGIQDCLERLKVHAT
jgi:hypothetical protein